MHLACECQRMLAVGDICIMDDMDHHVIMPCCLFQDGTGHKPFFLSGVGDHVIVFS